MKNRLLCILLVSFFVTSLFLSPVRTQNEIGPPSDYSSKTEQVTSWLVQAGGDAPMSIIDIESDSNGDIFVAGTFCTYYGTQFCNITLGNFNLVSAGSNDIFVAKMNLDGEFLWVRSIGSIHYDLVEDIEVDDNGNVFLVGEICAITTNCILISGFQVWQNAMVGEGSHGFVASYTSQGAERWLWTFGANQSGTRNRISSIDIVGETVMVSGVFCEGSQNYYDSCHAIFPDISTSVFSERLEEVFDIPIDIPFDIFSLPIPINAFDLDQISEIWVNHSHSTEGGADLFIGRLDLLGTFDWVEVFGSIGNDHVPVTAIISADTRDLLTISGILGDEVRGDSVVLVGATFCYLSGTECSMMIDNFHLTKFNSTDRLGDMVFGAYNESTDEWLWVESAGGFGDDAVHDIEIDSGRALMVGQTCYTSDYTGNCTGGFGDIERTFFGPGHHPFIASYNLTTNNWDWLTSAPNWGHFGEVEVTPNGDLLVAGSMSNRFQDLGDGVSRSMIMRGQAFEGGLNGFVGVLESDGNWSWGLTVGSTQIDRFNSVTLSENGPILIGDMCQSAVYQWQCQISYDQQGVIDSPFGLYQHSIIWSLFDIDADGWTDQEDNCPENYNPSQNDLDGDTAGDECDDDSDNDSIPNENDKCPVGEPFWTPDSENDYDSDGCHDDIEDVDDDNDGIQDIDDSCPRGELGWQSDAENDHDGDGCKDSVEDDDDDEDTVNDDVDSCDKGFTNWTSNSTSDIDGDGCNDLEEDDDDDNDGVIDENDNCIDRDSWRSNSENDVDGDGCRNSIDNNDDNDKYSDSIDDCPLNTGDSHVDKKGCPDKDGDGWSDDGDDFPNDPRRWSDVDGDGFADQAIVGFPSDGCPNEFGTSTEDKTGCLDSDGDGWSDQGDAFPHDSTKNARSGIVDKLFSSWIFVAIGLIAMLGAVFLFKKTRQANE